MPADTLPLESPMLPPLVLRPPLGPGLLRGIVLALAFIFHVVTAGWSQISNGREGDLASAARQMLLNDTWHPGATVSATGPLMLWLTKGSLTLFGVNEFAARLPTALAVMTLLWFTLRIGEEFGGLWRGFVASMVLLCSPGVATMACTLTPAPLITACITAACYALVRGFLHRKVRRPYFASAWVAMALGFFADGWAAFAIPLGTVLGMMLCYHTARLRFRHLWRWEALLILALTAGVAWASGYWGVSPSSAPVTAAWRLAAWQVGLFFPWSLLLLPAMVTLGKRLCSRDPLDETEAFPLIWAVVGLGIAMGSPRGSLFDTMLFWPAVALWCAQKLEVTPRRGLLRAIVAVFILAVGGLALASSLKRVLTWFFPTMQDFIYGIPSYFWAAIASVIFIAMLAFLLSTGAAYFLELHHHRRFSVIAFFAAMIPATYAFADTSAKFAPYFSYSDIAQCLNGNRGNSGKRVLITERPYATTSLRFYLDPQIVPEFITPAAAPQLPKAILQDAYVITRRTQLSEWEPLLGKVRVACASGGIVLIHATSEKSE